MRINNCHLKKSDFNSQLSISMKGGGGGKRGGFCVLCPFFPGWIGLQNVCLCWWKICKPQTKSKWRQVLVEGQNPKYQRENLLRNGNIYQKSQMSTNMRCKVWDSNSCNIVLRQVLHPCPTLLPYTIVTGLRLLIENKDTLLLLMTYQFLTSGVPLPLTVY